MGMKLRSMFGISHWIVKPYEYDRYKKMPTSIYTILLLLEWNDSC